FNGSREGVVLRPACPPIVECPSRRLQTYRPDFAEVRTPKIGSVERNALKFCSVPARPTETRMCEDGRRPRDTVQLCELEVGAREVGSRDDCTMKDRAGEASCGKLSVLEASCDHLGPAHVIGPAVQCPGR